MDTDREDGVLRNQARRSTVEQIRRAHVVDELLKRFDAVLVAV